MIHDRLWTPDPSDNLFMDLRYLRGFIQVQNLIERAIVSTIEESRGVTMMSQTKENSLPITYLQQFPYPKFKAEE